MPDVTASSMLCPICYRFHESHGTLDHTYGPTPLCDQCSKSHYWLSWEWFSPVSLSLADHEGGWKGTISTIVDDDKAATATAWTLLYAWNETAEPVRIPKTFRTPRDAIEAAQWLYDIEVGYPPLYNASPNPFFV